MSDNYDVVVIGAGSTGENVADRAVRGGLTAVLVEADLVGGDCSYWACMPSKALLRGGEALEAARAVDGARQAVSGGLAVAPTLERRDAFAAHWSDSGQVGWASSRGIDVVRGAACVTDVREVTVTAPGGAQRVLRARHAVAVCTGSEPSLPAVAGLAESAPWTTKDATSAGQPPESMIVLGGGPAGCELATAWASLGTRVTLIQSAPRLLHALEPFAGEAVAAGLGRAGIQVLTGVRATAVRRTSGTTTVTAAGGELSAAVLVVAAGRRPRTDGLGLEGFGIPAGRWLSADDSCRLPHVEGGWLYAAGDVNGRRLTTHQGKYQARVCGDAIVARAHGRTVDTGDWSPYSATADAYAAPGVVFTRPEVASVGRTEAQARAAGLAVRTVEYDLGAVAGAALYADGYQGRAKIVVDERARTMVGATLVGPGAGELIHAYTVAIVGQVPLDRLWHAVPSYPTLGEVWLRLLEGYGL